MSRLAGLVLLAVLLAPAAAPACHLCLDRDRTLSERFWQSDVVLRASWSESRKFGGNGGSTSYSIVDIIRSAADATLKRGERITVPHYRQREEGEQLLLFGRRMEKDFVWSSQPHVTEVGLDYLKRAPKPEAQTADRLRYFLSCLEHADPLISADAFEEITNADYREIVAFSGELPREKLRQWVFNPRTSPSRVGLYGLLLGLAGHPDDAEPMRRKIVESGDDFRLGIDGVMEGYLLLTGEMGLGVLERTKFADEKAPFGETYAAIQALRFLWNCETGRIPPERLKQSMRLLLHRPELADLVIADLTRWKDWSIGDRLMGMYGQQEYDIPATKRAIVRFYLACENEAKKHPEAVPADLAKMASQNLVKLEKQDPKTFGNAKKIFMLMQERPTGCLRLRWSGSNGFNC